MAIPASTEGLDQWSTAFASNWDERVIEETGISRVRKEKRSTLELGLAACRALDCLRDNSENAVPDDIISVSQTPERLVPGNASGIASAMGWTRGTERAVSLCWDSWAFG